MTTLTKPIKRPVIDTGKLLSGEGATAAAKVSPFRGSLKGPFPSSLRGHALTVYAASLTVAACTLAVVVALGDWGRLDSAWMLAVLGAFAAVAERQSIRLQPHTEWSISVLPVTFAAVVFGPSAAMIVAFVSLLSYMGRPYTRWIVWTATRVLVAGVGGILAVAILGDRRAFLGVLVATAAAAVVEGVGSALLTSVTVGLRHEKSFGTTLRGTTRMAAVTVPLYTPMLAILAYAFLYLSPWTVLFFGAPALAAHRLLRLYQWQARLTDDLADANATLERASVSFASALVAALDARDQYTGGHSAAVAVYARDIAAAIGLDEAEQQRAHLAGLLHDIGKVGVPPGILEKEGPLTAMERAQMETHSVIGERILENVEGYEDIARIVRHHHERMDGAGYPDGLGGSDIPILSRVIAVADAYDAMTSARPYRAALEVNDARIRLNEASGRQFDPTVVEAFGALLGMSAVAPRNPSPTDGESKPYHLGSVVREAGAAA